jgi:hypothetical protein
MLGQNIIHTRLVRILATLAALVLSHVIHVHAFFSPLPAGRPFHSNNRRASVTPVATRSTTSPSNNDVQQQQQQQQQADDEDDDDLLKTVTKAQLQDLCEQLNLPTAGTKQVLLKRLRQHAAHQAELERQRTLGRAQRVEEGSDDPKTRHEIVGDDQFDVNDADDDDDYDDEEGFFYFNTLDSVNATGTNISTPSSTPKKTSVHSTAIAAPPPPIEPNEKGERVVQIYSTTDQNDLTGIAAAQPGGSALGGDLAGGGGESNTPQPWDMDQSATRSETTTKEMDQAKEKVIELIQALLAMSGAPAFRGFADDLENLPTFEAPKDFVGFNPGQVPTELLTSSSQALRTGRGQVLADVLREFELQGIGQDGMAGDNVDAGGGHYREVSKVRAFLEGYRRAEVRRLARETSALLLDKLVVEGVGGLDLALAAMTRSSDDTSDHAGELNDSLLDYLNDAIRQQEKKVDQMVAVKMDNLSAGPVVHEEHDPIDGLWDVTMEDGQRIESIDPNDPKVQRVVQEEYNRAEMLSSSAQARGGSAPEQLLLLLTLLRERIKAEAAFAPDEKGRNLRLLAYCLQVSTVGEREQLIMNDIGNSLDVSKLRFDRSK